MVNIYQLFYFSGVILARNHFNVKYVNLEPQALNEYKRTKRDSMRIGQKMKSVKSVERDFFCDTNSKSI